MQQHSSATIVVKRGTRGSDASVASIVLVALMAFLTLVDLFAAQAILPGLALRYRTSPGMIGIAVNACTLGMAIASAAIAVFSMRIDRRKGIVASLCLLSVPTLLLAHAPDLPTFALLRVAQGLCMASAFALTLAWLGDRFTGQSIAAASAAYITGNVASNLFGRLISAAVADHFGLASSFYAFAALNLVGALLAATAIGIGVMPQSDAIPASAKPEITSRKATGQLTAACAIGFCILFAFIGTFSYVNFVLTAAPISIGQMQLGFVYLVFLPSFLTTPLAGRMAAKLGTRNALWTSLGIAAVGLPLLVTSSLPIVLSGLVLVGAGTFLAQATATGYVARTMGLDRGTASGIYLTSYFLGGLAGAALLGRVFDTAGWPLTVAGVALSLAVAALIAKRLTV